jgi:hypothetical protein
LHQHRWPQCALQLLLRQIRLLSQLTHHLQQQQQQQKHDRQKH